MSSRFVLRIVAAVIAVIAAFVGIMYLRFSGDGSKTVGVVVAARDIPAGAIITPDMVAIHDAPEAQTAPNVYQHTAEVIGQVTKVSLAPGEQVVPSKVAALPPWGTGLSGPLPARQSIGLGFGN